ncbi:MAG: DUF4111 domain-containing protein [Sphaerobacteraceae bacterium]|nr:MAG: DUF4111 domain-containing protein [Sphaerobacteraceae bacterium]
MADSLPVPSNVRLQLERLVSGFQTILQSNLRGVYLHGSLAMDCFNPALSDIDLLVRVRGELAPDDERRLIALLLEISSHPAPIELSVLSDADLSPWRYPTPYTMHFSEDWRASSDHGHGQPADRLDPDLAAHITVLRARGVLLSGEEIESVFPEVPASDFVDSLLRDVSWARQRISSQPVYAVLNLPRVLRYLIDGSVISKREAGEWALGRMSGGEDRSVLDAALRYYRGDADSFQRSTEEVHRYLVRIEADIEQRLRDGIHR